MKKIHEYEQHAAECRRMARTAPATHRAQLEQMAQTWDQLAEARKKQLEKLGKTQEDPVPSASFVPRELQIGPDHAKTSKPQVDPRG